MKRCRHCKEIFIPDWKENRSEYCPSCRDAGVPQKERDKKRHIKRQNAKTLGKIKNYEIGNPGQDRDILKFLRKKREREDRYYESKRMG